MSIDDPTNYAIGVIGLSHLTVLTTITLWRTVRFFSYCEKNLLSSYNFKKKMLFHILLLLASLFDIPMYISFIIYGEYTLILYSFHRFESALLFAAFSITIADWGALLFDIQEFKSLYLFLIRKASLVFLNTVYFFISIINFVFCYSLSDFNTYLNSPANITGIFIQVFVTLLLTCFMLHAGLKLSWRLKGAAGVDQRNNNSNRSRTQQLIPSWLKRSKPSLLPVASENGGKAPVRSFANTTTNAAEFLDAIRTLNIVMATCTACIFIQSILLILNYALGDSSSTSKSVGPSLFYWVFYFWLPVWGITLSLLYLSRTHMRSVNENRGNKVPQMSYSSRNFTSDLTGLLNPLVSEEDPYEEAATMTDNYEDAFRETQLSNSSASKSVLSNRQDMILTSDMGDEFSALIIDRRSVSKDNDVNLLMRRSGGQEIAQTPMKRSENSAKRHSGNSNVPYTTVRGGGGEDCEGDEEGSIDTLMEQHDGRVLFSPNLDMSYPFRPDLDMDRRSPENGILNNSDFLRPSESYNYFRSDFDTNMQPYLNVPHSVSFDAKANRESLSPPVVVRGSHRPST